MKFSLTHDADTKFEGGGLRGFFEYRDLGIQDATGGKVGAHVIRAVPGAHASGERHRHDLEFQMVYVLKGWVRFWYEGHGEVLLKPGSCVHQPPGIVHRELAHSDDLEMIEITLPAAFGTSPVPERASSCASPGPRPSAGSQGRPGAPSSLTAQRRWTAAGRGRSTTRSS